ncbi:LysE family translocator [Curvibacter sp. CHRR-16]|uniref:LysE family translocator n=1 Tax=Curvibacter sp. CHRR-16 TaxID=2835872 RepID=UPI001BD950F1|nr:LysE family translocator [Curvibacter sp. CHRR-16]MBT0571676.1 LysE family translocator [Curvibacter sp. CHRR-16]
MPLEQALFFTLTCIGFGFIPGPALLQTVSLTLQHGRRAGFLSALGIHIGAFFQICIMALGAVTVLKTSPMLYQVLKAVGGVYLIWLGIQRMCTPSEHDKAINMPQNVVSSSAFIEASNPKSALFYFSFLLQFTAPSTSLELGWQLFLLGSCANLLFSVADVCCILLAHPLHSRVTSGSRTLRICQLFAGMLFIVLGAIAIVGD